ncbi:MAG: hypothetical protein PVH62_09325 [Anaerolineae bacterium]|jgi:hypothetical protein
MERDERTPQGAAQQWHQMLIDDYYDYRWRQVIEPLCDKLQRWKDGELAHAEMDQTLEEVHQQVCEVRGLFSQREDRLVNLIQWLDWEWFEEWVESHSPPEGVRLAESPE